MSESSNKITYFLAGASIGALVALLFAPKSGRELRSDISDATRRGIDYTTESAKSLGEKASHLYTSGREKRRSCTAWARKKLPICWNPGRACSTNSVTGWQPLSKPASRRTGTRKPRCWL